MEKAGFDAMEVKPVNAGWYFVTMFQIKKLSEESPNYVTDWMEFDGSEWDYNDYKDNCYVCFVHEKE